MSLAVCVLTGTLHYPQGGGHQWVPLNWALALRAAGCEVIWLEGVSADSRPDDEGEQIATLESRLDRYDLADRVALFSWNGRAIPEPSNGSLTLDDASEADLLLNFAYTTPRWVLERFRRTALVDIDPGLLQVWMAVGDLDVPDHDVYFTIGETVGQPNAKFPDCGLPWQYTPPPVYLAEWPLTPAGPAARYTTVSDWWGEWVCYDGDFYSNMKRDSFLEYLELPVRAGVPLELCLTAGEDEERRVLEQAGWSVVDAWDVAATPDDYRAYIQRSRGEVSCAKPSCMRLENAWISDRTLCYMASGKPAIVQHTGPSAILPDHEGLFRFRNLEEAVAALAAVEADYELHCRLARRLVEERFDAKEVVASVLERALD